MTPGFMSAGSVELNLKTAHQAPPHCACGPAQAVADQAPVRPREKKWKWLLPFGRNERVSPQFC
jgi:hypothetical protein